MAVFSLDVKALRSRLQDGTIEQLREAIEFLNTRDSVELSVKGNKAQLMDRMLQHISSIRPASSRASVLQSELGDVPARGPQAGSMQAIASKIGAHMESAAAHALVQAATQHDVQAIGRPEADPHFVPRTAITGTDIGHAALEAGGGGGLGSSSRGGRGGVQHLLGGSGGAEVAGGTTGGLPLEAPRAAPQLTATSPHPKESMEVDRSESIYQRFAISSPQLTQRSQGAHSGLTPQVENTRQTVDDFLASAVPSLAALPVPPPMPGATVDPTLKAILEGVNELRANTVTKQTMQEFHMLQRAEYQAFVQAENAPLHNAVDHLSRDMVEIQRGQVIDSERIG